MKDDEAVKRNQYNYVGTITDLNTLKYSIPFNIAVFFADNVRNSPPSEGAHGGVVFTLNHWDNQGVQICCLNNVDNGLYVRFLYSNTWSGWKTFNFVSL